MALWGTVIATIFGGILTNILGKKQTLFIIGILYTISAIGSAFANDPWFFAFFRFLGGLGVGASTIAGPAYISEIAPANNRGKLVSLYEFNIVFGILIAFVSNYLLSGLGENAWRWMLGVEAFPAIIYTLLVLKLPKSPRWLISKSKVEEAKTVLAFVNNNDEIDNLVTELSSNDLEGDNNETIFIKKYRFAEFNP